VLLSRLCIARVYANRCYYLAGERDAQMDNASGLRRLEEFAVLSRCRAYRNRAMEGGSAQFGGAKRIRIGQLFGNPLDRVIVLFKVLGRTSAI